MLKQGSTMKKVLLLAGMLSGVVAAHATLYTTNWTSGFANGGVVPDANLTGWVDTRSVSATPAGTFASLSVNLHLTGGWNGDLYAYLVHDSGFTVLLNHVGLGVSGVGGFGYGDSGMDVTLASTGTSIHQYGGNSTFSSIPTGTWAADNSSGGLDSFLGTSPNGTWSLFIADSSGGGVSTVQGWGLQMDIVAVPEIETWVAAALAVIFGAIWVNRRICGQIKRGQHAL